MTQWPTFGLRTIWGKKSRTRNRELESEASGEGGTRETGGKSRKTAAVRGSGEEETPFSFYSQYPFQHCHHWEFWTITKRLVKTLNVHNPKSATCRFTTSNISKYAIVFDLKTVHLESWSTCCALTVIVTAMVCTKWRGLRRHRVEPCWPQGFASFFKCNGLYFTLARFR